ncbi:hypothetical protein BYT27DRAFT_7206837 [Phlegmacium glaucopus]|nr:hypothetical protein BYT27DRAFT_7206837 [Phlegmacium glaucopus]
MATGCALDELGNLKNLSDIKFFNSKTNTSPISGPPACILSGHSIGHAPSHEPLDQHSGQGATVSCKQKSNEDDEDSDAQDGDFAVASSDSESSDDLQFMGDEVVGNAELASILPSKSILTTGHSSGSHTRKCKATEVIEVEDEDSP